ncbi:MAG TPA: SRPBCC family protein [Noviherbaspirillum sp.]
MATIQQSIDINVPVHTAYNQLTQFEDYPRFMEEVEAVRQIDDTHLHWKTVMSNRPVEWDAEITEQEPDRCIAWRNVSGPTNTGKVEVEPAGPDSSRVTLTIQVEPEQVPGSSADNGEQQMAQRLRLDLARLKEFIESRRARTPSAPYAAGSEGFSGDEDATAPMTSASSRLAAGQWNDTTGPGGTAAAVGIAGGTDASAGAQQSGSKASTAATVQQGRDERMEKARGDADRGEPDISSTAGASAAGRTGLGSSEAGADASDTRTAPRDPRT